MSTISLASQVASLPLPLAHLVRRALNAKSPVERHHCAFYLGEAALKLAAVTRVGVWLAAGPTRGSAAARAVERLAHPSLGHWLAILRECDRELAARDDIAGLPLAAVIGRLSQPLAEAEPTRSLAASMVKEGCLSRDQARAADRRGVLGLFDLLVAYRNKVIGHGAQRVSAFYQTFADGILGALGPVLRNDVLFGDLELATFGEHGWRQLTGLAGMPTTSIKPTDAAVAEHLYMVGGEAAIDLHPLVVYQEDDRLQREHVGFLNGTVLKTRRRSTGDSEEVKRVEYLDYMTGEPLGDIDCRPAVAELLARVLGRHLSADGLGITRESAGDEDEPPAIEPGGQFGSFVIDRELGAGGMGAVYLARQEIVNRTVALKVLLPQVTQDPAARARFDVEVSALARADHPNVVKILTAGRIGSRPYFAMEYVDGIDLSHLEQTRETIKSAAGDRGYHRLLAELFAGAVNGVAHLHTQGVLHRDLKPANLVLTGAADRLVVMDLGLAKLTDESRNLTTSRVALLGTMRYVPPERFAGSPAPQDPRGDVYGLGTTLYELATGRPMFDGDTEARLIHQILHERPPPADQVSNTPGALAEIIDRATAIDPAERYGTAAELAASLEAFARGQAMASPARPAPGSSRPKWAVPTALVSVAAAVGAYAVISWSSMPDGARTPAAPTPVTGPGLVDASSPDRGLRAPAGMVELDAGTFAFGSKTADKAAALELCGFEHTARQPDCRNYIERVFVRETESARRAAVAGFYLDRHEVTVGELVTWLEAQPESPTFEDGQLRMGDLVIASQSLEDLRQTADRSPDLPVTLITWHGAKAYCEARDKRLPREIEWAYAAHREVGLFPWGETIPTCDDVRFGREQGMSCADANAKPGPTAVGTSRVDVTPHGIRDLGGNVAEWVEDAFASDEPECASGCRVVRGGDFAIFLTGLRSVVRSRVAADEGVDNVGFRCARSLD